MYDGGNDRDRLARFRSRRTWVRGFFMLLFLFALWFVRLLLTIVAIFQFGAQLIAQHPLHLLFPLGRSMGIHVKQTAMFLTFNTEELPFPFSPWPGAGAPTAVEQEKSEKGVPEGAREPKESNALLDKWRRIFPRRHPPQQK